MRLYGFTGINLTWFILLVHLVNQACPQPVASVWLVSWNCFCLFVHAWCQNVYVRAHAYACVIAYTYVCMYTVMCMNVCPPPRLVITTCIKWSCISQLVLQLSSFFMWHLALIAIIDRCGLSNKVCHECLLKEPKVTLY